MTYLTGMLPSRHGVQDWLVPADSAEPASRRWLEGLQTYTDLLQRAGYTLGMCGKWHLGRDAEAQEGFTYWATVPGGSGPYRDPEFVHNGTREKPGRFKTDAVTDYAIDFLNQQKNGHPFYLLVPFFAPHTPYDYQPEECRRWYNDAAFRCFPNTPMHPWQNPGLARMFGSREAKHAYSALISGVDANIGRVLTRLEELRLREDTLVVFTADQGWNAGHHGVWGKGNGTIPFNLYEESLRVPLIWNQPGHIAAGRTASAMVSTYDFFPTILDYLGVTAKADPRRVGRSYAAFLRGRSPSWRSRLYFEYAHVRGIRTRTLKYLERAEGYPNEMFDLEADPAETRNVIDVPEYRQQRDAFHRELTRYFAEQGAPPLEEWRSTTKQALPAESLRKGPAAK
jgi:arylsulfatase A-like enzyme